MTMDQHLPHTAPPDAAEHSMFASFWSGLATWIRACGNAYVTSAIYADLSRLSDVELKRRGLSRETLAREVFDSSDHRG